jgi:hypothetical protein
LKIACEKYDFGWSSTGPIHSRTRWLEAGGLVNLFSHKVHISEAGQTFLNRIEVYQPDSDVTSPTDLRTPPRVIQDKLDNIAHDQRIRSRAGSLYVPAVKTNNGQIEALEVIVETCTSPTRDEMLIAKVATIFGGTRATAETAIRSFRLLGLIERVSATEIAATPAGIAWVTGKYEIDLARVIHSSVWYFGEIIGELETAGRLTFTNILERCSRYSLNGFYDPLKRGGLTARVALLESLGLIANVSGHYYRPTKLGSAFLHSIPHIEPENEPLITGSSEEPEWMLLPGDVRRDRDPIANPERKEHNAQLDDGEAERIAEKLERTARFSEDPAQLEYAAIEALTFLGFPATHIGGNERPDGTVRTRPGRLGSVLTVETKSAANGAVPEEQAKPATLAHHRDQYDAVATVYIGPGFEQRLLDVLDDDEQVAVVSAVLIAESVRRQVATPLVPEELEPLIDPSLREKDRRRQLLAKWKDKEDSALCMRGIVEVTAREAESPMSDSDTSSAGVGWLDLVSIRRSLRDILGKEMTKDVISEALTFLASPHVGVLEQDNERFRVRVTLESAPRHFAHLGHWWSVGDQLLKRDSS